MSPKLEFLGYFIVLLVGTVDYLVQREIAGPLFVVGVFAYLAALRFLCRETAKQFRFDEPAPRTDP